MRHSVVGGVLAVALSLAAVATLPAQETGTPVFKSPYRAFERHEFGVSFSDPGSGVSYALEGFYSYGWRNFDIGLRGGFADLTGTAGTRGLAGVDARTRLLNATEKFPLDGAFTLGAGVEFGDGPDVFAVPIGVSLGRHVELEGSQVTFTPYVHPVVMPVFTSDDSDVQFAFGLGVDIRLSRFFSARVSGGIGDIDGVAVSAAFIR
jgi:hypothetical protein